MGSLKNVKAKNSYDKYWHKELTMNRWITWKRNWQLPMLGIILLMLGYLAWGLFTISYKADFFGWMAFLVTILAVVCFAWISYRCAGRESADRNREQWCIVSIVIGAGSIILMIRGGAALWEEKNFTCLMLEGLWCVASLASAYVLFDRQFFSSGKVKSFFKENTGILILLAVTVCFCIEPDAFQYRWDGLLYYLTCRDLSLRSLSSLAIYGHIAQTFGALAQMGNIIFRDTGIALYVMNVVLMLVSITYFYKIVKHCLPDKGQWLYGLLTAVYACSPYLLGMVPYYNLDFACQCLVVPVIYYLICKKWVLLTFFALCFCFTKEPAILVYGALCVGTATIDIVEDRGYTLVMRIRRCFSRAHYYIMAMPGVLWLATYKMLGPWSAGDSDVGIAISYIVEKLKNLYLLNFNWIFTITVAIGIVFMIYRKDRETGKLIFPLICSQAAFTGFSCLFQTVNHPRYNDTNQVTLYLMALLFLGTYTKKLVSCVFGGIMWLLLLLSSFYTIDPVSLLAYQTYNVGNAVMITTGDNPLGDFMIYNRQMLGMERALERAVADSIQDEVMVCFPAIGNNPYYFDGMCAVGALTEYRFDVEYWDTERNRRVPENGLKVKEFTVCQIPECVDWLSVEPVAGDQVDLIYMNCAGEQWFNAMKKYYVVDQEEEYHYRGWTVYRVRFRVG